ncbi:MAG: TonB-dependent receptor plug domain-containing protein, partial [Caulobacteraceae bacterium]
MARTSFAAYLLAGSSAAMLATAAAGQTPAPAPANQGPISNPAQGSSPTPTPAGEAVAPVGAVPQSAAVTAPAAAVSEVVVTGSRLIKNGSASPTPLTTINTSTLQLAAPIGTIADSLNDLPVFSGSRSSISNPGASASAVQGGNGSANVLNLRNLGAYRTLVLYDGHRIPPTLFNSTVDVDLIPQELVDRVDVVTGGVSAVYGSDAVSGVVNFVANRTFEGFRGHAEYGVSQEGDDNTWDVGLAYGSKILGDKGHIEFSVQHRDSAGIPNRSARSWDNLPAAEGLGTAADPYRLYTNVH